MATVMEERLKQLSEALASGLKAPEGSGSLDFETLQASECVLIEAYEHTIHSHNPTPCDSAGGYAELGPVLYWLNHPDDKWKNIVKVIVDVLELLELKPLPASRISTELYEKIKKQAETTGVVAPDGTIYGEGTYEALDWGWLEALFYFAYYQYLHKDVHSFGSTPQIVHPTDIKPETRIAIVGDWGTGKFGSNGGPAFAVMNAIESLDPKPDYLIHMGDVYYVGTSDGRIFSGRETTNFMDLWPKDRRGGGTRENTSFTLNSNHEMYDGGNGYFNNALGADKTPFALQKGTSYFALVGKPWVILGLDSAYYASASSMFLQGSLGPKDGDQLKWVAKNFGILKGKNVIVLTHHNGISDDGVAREPIWDELKQALGARPDYWYWGHIHNGIVYSDSLPATEGAKVRCIGHSSIPYAKAWGLEHAAGIEYYGQTPEGGKGPRVRNGFAVLTLKSDGTVDEVFYEVEDGTSKPIVAWKS